MAAGGIMIVRLRTEGMRCHSCEQVLSAWVRDIRALRPL